MKKILKNNKWIFVLLFAIIIPLVIHILFTIKAPYNFLIPNWEAGEILAYIGTMALVILAVWQNNQANEVNKKLQIKNIELQKIQNDIRHLEKIKENIKNIILSFDVNVFYLAQIKAVDVYESYSITNIIDKLEKSLSSANDSDIYFLQIFSYAKLNKFSCVYKEYRKKYKKIITSCIEIWYEILFDYRNRMAYLENAKIFMPKDTKESLNVEKEQLELLLKKVQEITKKYTDNSYKDFEKDINNIKSDIIYLEKKGYDELKHEAYLLLNQCDEEIEKNYNKIAKDIDTDFKY